MYVFLQSVGIKRYHEHFSAKKASYFSVQRSEKSEYFAKIHMEYFHVGIFVIPRACLVKKYGFQNKDFFSVFHCSSGCCVLGMKYVSCTGGLAMSPIDE